MWAISMIKSRHDSKTYIHLELQYRLHFYLGFQITFLEK